MTSKTEKGIESVEIMALEELNKVIGEPNEVLVYERNTEEDTIVFVTQGQITAI